MIDIATFKSVEAPMNYCRATYNSGYLDDQLWVLAMSTARYLDEIFGQDSSQHRGDKEHRRRHCFVAYDPSQSP